MVIKLTITITINNYFNYSLQIHQQLRHRSQRCHCYTKK